MSRFKNKLCLSLRPEARGWDWSGVLSRRRLHTCKRHAGHLGQHRAVYSDAIVYWDDAGKEVSVSNHSSRKKTKD